MIDSIKIRHTLHAHPELSRHEVWTSTFIIQQLRSLGIIKIHTGFSQHSIIAEIDGSKEDLTLLFRCELDALPIQESNTFDYKSSFAGVSHKCGHDGHSATMLDFAQKLMLNPPLHRILLFFQSAEEIGEGAKLAIESGFFKQFSIDYVFAYHNLPSFPLGSILCKAGVFTPSVESFCLTLIGKNCHASQPSNGINPANALADFIKFMGQFHQPDKTQAGYFVVTPIHVNMGEKSYGIAAGEAEIGYTIRTWSKAVLEQHKQQIVEFIDKTCQIEQLTYQIDWLESFVSNNNHALAYQHVCLAAAQSNVAFIELQQPLDFGEDFGLFTSIYKGAMFGIGAGENCPALHTTDYDFPDELIKIGSELFYQLSQISE